MQTNRGIVFVSFSGIDGAGKSTQILQLVRRLGEMQLRVFEVTFWTDIVALRRFRERLSYKVFRGDRGVGSPDRPVKRRDKNVSAWYLTVIRCCFYFLDAINLKHAAAEICKSSFDVVIFDRYIYDELANLPLANPFTRKYLQLLLKLSPKPDLAFLLDADAREAHARKPEYPKEFVERNRASFVDLAKQAGMKVVGALPAAEIAHHVEREVLQMFWSRTATGSRSDVCPGCPSEIPSS